jgi:DNA-binding NarL/FixJ family response regulator
MMTPRRKLSPRQIEVITLVAKGYAYKEIADQLMIAEKTVQSHAQAVGHNFDGCFDKVAMTHFAIQHGLVQPGDYRAGNGFR